MEKSEQKSACRDSAVQLFACMERTSPCVRDGGKIMECLSKGELGDCEATRRGYFECRRGQLDMRTRIKGRKFIDVGGTSAPE